MIVEPGQVGIALMPHAARPRQPSRPAALAARIASSLKECGPARPAENDG
jgi:hypothetical protein